MTDKPSKILIVEDEALIAMDLEELVRELGLDPVGPARNVPSALQLIADNDVDAGILDLFVDGALAFEVADELSRRGKPFLFTTGYDPDVLHARYDRVQVCPKPFTPGDLQQGIMALLEPFGRM